MSISLSTVKFVFREKTVAHQLLIFRPMAVRESRSCAAAFWTFGGGIYREPSQAIYTGVAAMYILDIPLCVFNEIKKFRYVRSDSPWLTFDLDLKSLVERDSWYQQVLLQHRFRNAEKFSFSFFRCKNSTHLICLFSSPKKEFNFV